MSAARDLYNFLGSLARSLHMDREREEFHLWVSPPAQQKPFAREIGKPRMLIKCTKCLEVKDEAEFHRDKRKINGRTSWCKACENAQQKEHRDIPEVKAARKEYNQTDVRKASNKKYNDKIRATPEGSQKMDARKAVHNAVEAGRLIKPDVCEITDCTETKLQGHHYLGYADFNKFNIQWLCMKHHREADAFQERAKAVA